MRRDVRPQPTPRARPAGPAEVATAAAASAGVSAPPPTPRAFSAYLAASAATAEVLTSDRAAGRRPRRRARCGAGEGRLGLKCLPRSADRCAVAWLAGPNGRVAQGAGKRGWRAEKRRSSEAPSSSNALKCAMACVATAPVPWRDAEAMPGCPRPRGGGRDRGREGAVGAPHMPPHENACNKCSVLVRRSGTGRAHICPRPSHGRRQGRHGNGAARLHEALVHWEWGNVPPFPCKLLPKPTPVTHVSMILKATAAIGYLRVPSYKVACVLYSIRVLKVPICSSVSVHGRVAGCNTQGHAWV
eukprot:354024-Chlamydomonas_euryale.AAC.7